MSWADDAECARLPPGEGDRIFFGGNHYGEAAEICGRCPVVEPCRADVDRLEASVSQVVIGYRAGETPAERIDRRAGRSRNPGLPCPLCSAGPFASRRGLGAHHAQAHGSGRVHGTDSCYQAGCRRSECRAAHAAAGARARAAKRALADAG